MSERAPWDTPDNEVAPWDAPASKALPRTMTVKQQLLNNPVTSGAYGLLEGATALGTGAITQAVGGLAGAGMTAVDLLRGKSLPEALESGAGVIEKVGSKAYQPTTEQGQFVTDVATLPMRKAGEGWGMIGGAAGKALGNEELGETLGKVGAESLMAVAPVPKVLKQARAAAEAPKPLTFDQAKATYGPERQNAQQVKATVDKAASLEAAEAAQRHGIAVDLPDLDKGGMARRLATPDDVQRAMEEANRGKPEMALKTAVGIAPETPLTLQAVEANLERLAGPKRQIQAMSGFVDDGTARAQINALIPERTVGMGDEFNSAVREIAKIRDDIARGKGMQTGTEIVSSIEKHRQQARDLLGGTEITRKKRDLADIHRGTADALEGIIERNIGSNPQLLAEYIANREKMAQTYLLRDILDNNTQMVDLSKLSRMTGEDTAITGAFSDIGKIYSVSPESFKALPKETSQFRWSRYTVPGAIGAAIGTTLAPGLGSLAGAGAGALLSNYLGGRAGRKLASPAYQSRYAEALRNRSRGELGYGPAEQPLELAPRGPLPPQGMTGQQFGSGPADTGILSLAPQLDTRLPSEGMGPQAALRAGTRDTTPQSPQMPAIDMPLKADMPQQLMGQFFEAMQKGDEAAMMRLQAQYDAMLAEGQFPNPAHSQLYEPFRSRQSTPFADALRNFQGAQ